MPGLLKEEKIVTGGLELQEPSHRVKVDLEEKKPKNGEFMRENLLLALLLLHYVLSVLKTSLWDPRCQTYIFKTGMTYGIQKWIQNNQFQTLPNSDFFQITFLGTNNH